MKARILALPFSPNGSVSRVKGGVLILGVGLYTSLCAGTLDSVLIKGDVIIILVSL